ncbi:hypothetical protein VTO42DRAFT_8149 [Malbranchea cinnamomea]
MPNGSTCGKCSGTSGQDWLSADTSMSHGAQSLNACILVNTFPLKALGNEVEECPDNAKWTALYVKVSQHVLARIEKFHGFNMRSGSMLITIRDDNSGMEGTGIACAA